MWMSYIPSCLHPILQIRKDSNLPLWVGRGVLSKGRRKPKAVVGLG